MTTGAMRGSRLLWLMLALAGVCSAPGQLVIDRSAPTPYPMPPKVEAEPEEEKPKPPPAYSGERIAIPAQCQADRFSGLGMVCNASNPCEMRLELTAVGDAGEAVIAIGDLYSSSATVESIVLRSSDDGATWVEAADRIAGAALDEMQFADQEHGWIVGRDSVGGGHHPFLMATSDGGKSWDRRPVDEDEDYRGEVLQLRFDSPEHGFLIVERSGQTDPFEMRESFNGGRSWALRQVTADRPALPGSRRRAPDPRITVREDSSEDLYVVERRDADAPRPLARFLASAGVCAGE